MGLAALARALVAEGLADGISGETVRRILRHHELKPWRHHLWLSAKTARDGAFARQVQDLVDVYTCSMKRTLSRPTLYLYTCTLRVIPYGRASSRHACNGQPWLDGRL